jgi:Ras-related protein Rab-5C
MNKYRKDVRDSKNEKCSHVFKCVLLGSAGTGKTSIAGRYILNNFNPYITTTIGSAFDTKVMDTSLGPVRLDLWDTAGQERFNSMIPLYYRDADIVLSVYDITCNESYRNAKGWIKKIKTENVIEPIFVLVGNKSDMSDHRNVSAKEAKEFSKTNDILFFECSAKTGENIVELFGEAAKLAIKKTSRFKSSYHGTNTIITLDLDDDNSKQGTNTCFSCFNPMNYVYTGTKSKETKRLIIN